MRAAHLPERPFAAPVRFSLHLRAPSQAGEGKREISSAFAKGHVDRQTRQLRPGQSRSHQPPAFRHRFHEMVAPLRFGAHAAGPSLSVQLMLKVLPSVLSEICTRFASVECAWYFRRCCQLTDLVELSCRAQSRRCSSSRRRQFPPPLADRGRNQFGSPTAMIDSGRRPELMPCHIATCR
jgi:hypothetical protein